MQQTASRVSLIEKVPTNDRFLEKKLKSIKTFELEKNVSIAKEELDRFDDNFEKGFTKMHIHDYNHMRKNLVDELLLAKQRLSRTII